MNKIDIFQDKEFVALPQEKKTQVLTNYFDKNFADNDFIALPQEKQSSIKQNFINAQMGFIDNAKQEVVNKTEAKGEEPKQEISFFNKVKDFGKTYADNITDTFIGARPFGTEDATKDLKNKVFDNVLGGLGGVQEISEPLKVENPNPKFQYLENNLKQEIKTDTENQNKKIEDNLIQDIENLSKIDTRLIRDATQEQKDKYLNNIAGILGKGGYALGQKEDGNYVAIDKEGNEKEIKNDLWNSILDGIKADAGELTGAIYGAKKGLDLSKNMKNPIAKTATIAGSSVIGSVAGNSLDMGINQLKGREDLGIEDILNELGKTAVLDVAGNVVGAGIVKVGGKIIELPKQARDYFLNGNIEGAREILKKDLNIDDKYIEDAINQMKQNYKESENYSKNIAPEDSSFVSKVTNKIGGDIRNLIGQQEELLAATLQKGDTNIIAGALDETAARNLSNTIDQRATNVLNTLENKSSKASGEEVKNYLNAFENKAKQDFSNMRKDFNEAFKQIDYKFELDDLNLNDTFRDMAKRVQDPDAKKRFLTLQSSIKNTIYDSNAQVGIERDINGLLDMRQQINKFYGQNEKYLANKKDKDTFNALKENLDNQIYKTVNENLPPELGTRLIDSFSKAMNGYRELGSLQDNKVFKSIMGDANNPEFRMDKLVKHMADDDSYVDDVLSKMTPQARQTVEVAVIKELADSYTLKTAQGQKGIAFEDLGKELESIKRNVRSELGKETIDNLITYAEKFGNRDIAYLDMTKGITTKPKGNISTSLGGKIEMQISSWRFDMLQRMLPTDTGKRLSLQRHIREALQKSRTPQEFDLKLYEYPDLSDNSRNILKSMIKNNNKILSAKSEEEAQKALAEAKEQSQKIINDENKLKDEIANFKIPEIYEIRTVAGLTPDDKFGSFSQMTTKIQKGTATPTEIEQYIKARNNIAPEDLEKNILKMKYPINSRVIEKLQELQSLNKEKVDEIVNQDEYKALVFNLKNNQLPNTTPQIEDKYRQKFYELNKIYDEEKALQKAKIEAENKAFEEADKQGFIPFAKFTDNLLAGTVAGVETDENGNIVGFDPEMFVAGLGGYTALKTALKNKEIQGALKDYAIKIVDYVDMNPALYKENGLNAMFVGAKPNEIGAFSDVATKKVMKEINDGIATFKPIPKQEVEIDGEFFEQNFGKLGDILVHDELFKQYPDLKEVQVSVNNNIGRGATYNEYIDHIALDGGLVKTVENNVIKDLQNKIKELDKNPIDKDYKILNDKFFDKNLSKDKAEKILNLLDNTPTQIEIDKLSNQLSKEFKLNKQNAKEVEITEEGKITLLHEIQHTIQGRENWARGGSPKEFNLRGSDKLNQSFIDEADALRKPKVEELISQLSQGKISKEEFKKIYNEMPETQTIREWTENIANSKDPFGAYQRLWGEQQARATSYRANYTPEQRASEDWTNTLEKNEGKYNEPIIKYGDGSAMSQEAEKLKRDENFKKWFNGSKVVDKNGEPKVFYHESNAKFNTFSKDKIGSSTDGGFYGKGFYFDSEKNNGFYGKNEYEVFLNIKKPFDMNYKDNSLFSDVYYFGKQIKNLESFERDYRRYFHYADKFFEDVKIHNMGDGEYKYKVQHNGYRGQGNTKEEALAEAYGRYMYDKFDIGGVEHAIAKIGRDNFSKNLQKEGYDGTFWGTEAVVFEPTQIKSIHNKGTFDKTNPNIMMSQSAKDYKDNQGFYSVLEKTIDEKVGGKIDSISLAKVLENNGVKIDELEWSGLRDLLASKEKLTKEEIQNTINENRLVLEKVSLNQNQEINKKLVLDYNDLDKEILDYLNSLDNESKKIAEEMMTVFDRSKITDGTYGKEWNELKSKYPNLDHNIIHEVGEALKDEAIDKNLNRKLPKYSEYKVDGGENYREILFRMPTDIEKKLDNEIKIVDGGDGYFYAEYAPFDGTNVITGAKSKKQLLSEISSGYKSNHWDESNIVVFTRVDDRRIENKKTLFLEELQSDWHQDGRKKGYGKKIPDAPFKKNWSELGIKRMIQEAVENDYDKLAWTTGKQQADRYSLEKQIDTVVYNKESGILQASKDGDEVVFKKVANDEEVAGLLGKDLANRLINPKQSTKDNIYVLEGEEVKFGGDGMKAFYDEIVPNTVKKLFKKYNVKPKMEELDDVSEMVWTIDITQKMKEDIKKYGQPLYAVGGAIAVGNEINNGDNNAK